MMKKITRIAALLAATALLFGAIGCSDEDDGDDPTLEKIAISIDEKTVKTTYTVGEPFDKSGITVTATYSDDSTEDVTADATFTATTADGEFTTAKAGEYDVTLTATYGEITSDPVSCKITVGSNDNNDNNNDNNNNNDDDKDKEEQKVLAVTYDLKDGLPAAITSIDAVISADWAAPTATPATNDVTWAWVATKDRKVKSNSGLQFSNGTSAEEAIKLSADKNITVKVTYKFAGDYVANKIREIDVGDKVSKMESTTNKESTYDITCSAAKEVSIKGNGVKILEIETAAAE